MGGIAEVRYDLRKARRTLSISNVHLKPKTGSYILGTRNLLRELRVLRGSFFHWQRERDGRAMIEFALGADRSTMRGDEVLGNG